MGSRSAPVARNEIRLDRRNKVLTLAELSRAADDLRRNGRRIVLCHGVFDLFHVGHLRHLNAARAFGDALVVTITADEFVSKGPNRPAFPAELRAEMLAGLELVDHVAIVDEPSAAAAIRAVKPRYFVKGGEYSDAKADLTGKITAEKGLVEALGGELVFTDDITFSSSNLLNRYFAVHDEPVRDYLAKIRHTDIEHRFARILERIEAMRIVVIGETIIDRYVYVDAMGKAAKENIIATLHRDEEMFAGGVIAVANDLAALSPNVELVSLIGDPVRGDNFEAFIRTQLSDSVAATFIHRPSGPTVQKTRFVEPTYVRKLFEVYHMDDRPLPDAVQDEFHATLSQKLAQADLVVVCDFGHGMISPQTVELLEAQSAFLAINAQSNAGNIGYNLIDKYHRADFVCLDASEARLAVRDKHVAIPEIVAKRLPKLLACDNVIVTHGRAGCFARKHDEAVAIPSLAGAVVDTVGAGDAFFAIAAPCLAGGADCESAGFIGNVAAAIKVGIVGHRRYLTRFEIQRYLATLLK